MITTDCHEAVASLAHLVCKVIAMCAITPSSPMHEYESVEQLEGSLSQQHSTDPVSFERGNYVRLLGSYRVPDSVWR